MQEKLQYLEKSIENLETIAAQAKSLGAFDVAGKMAAAQSAVEGVQIVAGVTAELLAEIITEIEGLKDGR